MTIKKTNLTDEESFYQAILNQRQALYCRQRILRPVSRMKPLIKSILASTGLDFALKQPEIVGAWNEITDRQLAEHTRAVSFRQGIFVVECTSATLRQELTLFRKEELLLRLRESLPGVAILDIRFLLRT